MTLRLLALGATGHIGTHVLDLALARGHQVTAFVRSPAKVQRNAPGLSIIQGSPMSTDALARALEGHDAVLSSIGPTPLESIRPHTLMAETAASTVAAMTRTGVKRLVVVSSAMLFPAPGLGARMVLWLFRELVRDLVAMETVVRATDLDWTIARPPRLVEKQDEAYRWQRDAPPPKASSMPFRAVAAFLVDSAERRAHVHEIVGLADRGAS